MLFAQLTKLKLIPELGLWADNNYLRLWISLSITSLGGQVTMLALPLTAALLLKATPMQMGLLTALELLPFALFSLPAGVWLDRVRKLPLVIAGEALFVVGLVAIAVAAWTQLLTMHWLYIVGFGFGCLHVVCGAASQILLTQIVPREKLVEAHSKNALAQSFAEVGGPSIAGVLIQALTAPLALIVDACAFLLSIILLKTIKVNETAHLDARHEESWVESIKHGLRFVWRTPALRLTACVLALWQVLHLAYHTVIVLFATRTLGFSPGTLGVLYTCFGVGSLLASARGEDLGKRFGIGPCLVHSIFGSALAWSAFALTPAGSWLSHLGFGLGLALFGFSASVLFIHFLALRQAVTPPAMLGRMTSTMRFIIIAGAPLGSLLGGAIAEWVSLRAAIAFSAVGAFGLWFGATKLAALMSIRGLPTPSED